MEYVTQRVGACSAAPQFALVNANLDLARPFPWYALFIRQRYREQCEEYLQSNAYEIFSPVRTEIRQWSDRKKVTSVPLFPGYLFCRFDARQCAPIWRAPGVMDVLNAGGRFLEVDTAQIESVQRCVDAEMSVEVIPELVRGQKVLITSGPMAGVTGVLAFVKQQLRVGLEVTMMNRTVLTEIHASQLSPI